MSLVRQNSQFFIPTSKTGTGNNNGRPQIRYLANNEFRNLALEDTSGSTIEVSVDSATYVVTVNLKNAAGTVISTSSIDLPLESVVVNASYANGVLTLTLQNGNTVDIPLTSILDGLVTINTDQTITGVKTFTNGIKLLSGSSKIVANWKGEMVAEEDTVLPESPKLNLELDDTTMEATVSVKWGGGRYDYTECDIPKYTVQTVFMGKKCYKITKIKSIAFRIDYELTRVSIPNTIIEIGYSAFASCTALTSIVLPSSLITIGSEAFSSSALTSIVIPDKVTTIGDYAFWNCTSLASAVIPASVTSIGANTFSGCTALTTITVYRDDENDLAGAPWGAPNATVKVIKKITSTQEATWNGKLSTSGDGSNVTVTIGTETKGDVNTDFASGSKISKLWGKAKAWFASLGSLAFKSSVTSSDVDGTIATTSDLANYVDLSTAQSVGGEKTFTSNIIKKNTSYAYSDAPSSNSWGGVRYNDKNDYIMGDIQFGVGTNFNALEILVRNKNNVTKNVRLVGYSSDWHFMPATDNEINLGRSANRWKDVFLAGNLSDGTNTKTVKQLCELSNPNLLINSNFEINQRGASDYTCGNNSMKYTVDRWKGNTTAAANSVKVTPIHGLGLYLEVTNACSFWQEFEKYSDLWGKTVTYSVNIGGTVRSYTVTLPSDAPASNTNWTAGYVDNIRIRLAYFTGGYFRVMIDCNTTKNFYVYWAKLEIGSTPTAYVPPLIAEELPKCQRYYFVYTQTNAVFNGFCFSNTEARINIPFTQTMRVSPTMTLGTGASTARLYTNGTIIAPSAVSIQSNNGNSINISVTISGGSQNHACGFRFLQVVTFDAEIY